MRILVCYASPSGFTQGVAGWLADEVGCRGHDAELVDVREDPDPDPFEAVLVGSGIRAGQWHKAGVSWLAAHRDVLALRPLATFTSSLEPAEGTDEVLAKVDAYTQNALAPLGLSAVAHRSFAGGYDPARVRLPERLIMRAMRQATPCDHRDEAAVRAWTAEVLEDLAR